MKKGSSHVGKSLAEFAGPAEIRPHDVVGQQHVLGARIRQHFGFGERGAFMLSDAPLHLNLRDLLNLVRLAVRTKSGHVTSD